MLKCFGYDGDTWYKAISGAGQTSAKRHKCPDDALKELVVILNERLNVTHREYYANITTYGLSLWLNRTLHDYIRYPITAGAKLVQECSPRLTVQIDVQDP